MHTDLRRVFSPVGSFGFQGAKIRNKKGSPDKHLKSLEISFGLCYNLTNVLDMKHPSCKKRPIGVFSRSFQMVVHLESIKDLAIFY